MTMKAACPFCNCTEFKDFRGRKREVCAGCRSKTRNRATMLILDHYCKITPDTKIAHFAPEGPIVRRLMPVCGENYQTFDINPARYRPEYKTKRCDLCADLPSMPQGHFDIVIHNHVLEHLPCNYTIVLQQLHELLKPGGTHIFSCPIQKGFYRADYSPKISSADRKKRFGQKDHVARFGADDFEQTIGKVFGIKKTYSLTDFVPEHILLAGGVPSERWSLDGLGPVFVVPKS